MQGLVFLFELQIVMCDIVGFGVCVGLIMAARTNTDNNQGSKRHFQGYTNRS